MLLGVSGESDSLALFEAFLNYGKIEIAVAHVDHGWRKESARKPQPFEGISSQKKSISISDTRCHRAKGNLEEASREHRYASLDLSAKSFGYRALQTGHHAQDQEETVLKRILRGWNKTTRGIRPVREVLGVTVFRPFLEIDKGVLQEFAKCCHLAPVEDPSNANPAYLRARMRTTIVPI